MSTTLAVSRTMKLLESSRALLPVWAWRLLERIAKNQKTPLDSFHLRPDLLFRLIGLSLDPWQARVLGSPSPRILMLCSRQVGKSLTAAAVALRTALLEAPATVLVISPSERQSGELVQKVKTFYAALKRPRRLGGAPRPTGLVAEEEKALDAAWAALPDRERESALQLHLDNGSRIVGLPAKPATILGYSGVSLLVIDEASRVQDDLYRSVRPMLAASRGRLLALTTPFGKRGWFYDEWQGVNTWERVKVTAPECPRIPREFLAEEFRSLGERWYNQEYLCSFADAIDAVFGAAVVEAAMTDDVKPLFGGSP